MIRDQNDESKFRYKNKNATCNPDGTPFWDLQNHFKEKARIYQKYPEVYNENFAIRSPNWGGSSKNNKNKKTVVGESPLAVRTKGKRLNFENLENDNKENLTPVREKPETEDKTITLDEDDLKAQCEYKQNVIDQCYNDLRKLEELGLQETGGSIDGRWVDSKNLVKFKLENTEKSLRWTENQLAKLGN